MKERFLPLFFVIEKYFRISFYLVEQIETSFV